MVPATDLYCQVPTISFVAGLFAGIPFMGKMMLKISLL